MRRRDSEWLGNNTTLDSDNAAYNSGNKDVFNNELLYYAWEVDTDEVGTGTKSGYTLDWYLRPNTDNTSTNSNITPEDKVNYTGNYTVWQGVPAAVPSVVTKTPYRATSTPERQVTDTVVQEIPAVFEPSDASLFAWNSNIPSGARIQYDDDFESAEIINVNTGTHIAADNFYATLAFGPSEVVQHWSAMSQDDKNTNKHTYCTAGGIFNGLADHNCYLVSINNDIIDISDKNSTAFEFFMGDQSPFTANGVAKSTGLNTIRMNSGFFNIHGVHWDARSGSGNANLVNIDGSCRGLRQLTAYSTTEFTMSNNQRMNGTYQLNRRSGGTSHYIFNNCAIAPDGGLNFVVDPNESIATGDIMVSGAPNGATFGTGITPANTLIVHRNLFTGENSGTSERGRLDIFDSNYNLVAGDVQGVFDDVVVTYTISSAQFSGLTGNVIAVWSRFDYPAVRVPATLTTGRSNTITMLPAEAPDFPSQAADGVNLSFATNVNSGIGFDTESNFIVVGVTGATGGDVPSASQTAELLSRELFGTADYNRMASVSQTAAEAVTFFGTAYSVVNFNHIKFTPGAAETQSLGYISPTDNASRTEEFTTGGNTYHVNIPSDAPTGLTEDQVRTIVDTQLQPLVANQRNISLGIPV